MFRTQKSRKPVRAPKRHLLLEVLEGRYALAAMLPGFDANVLANTDDGSTSAVNLGFTIDYFGTQRSQLFVNNNGSITFGAASGTFTPTALTNQGQTPRIAPFFADVDTRGAASADVTYGPGTVDGHLAFGVNWNGVGYFNSQSDKLNKFQLVLIHREDVGPNDFDIQFNYDQIQWETGSASGGSGGLGGTNARLGYTNGSGNSGTYFEMSGATRSFLDSSISTGLIHHSFNSDVDGRFVFLVRGGEVVSTPLPFNFTVSGAINSANPTNDWGFFGRRDQSVTIHVHTGAASDPPQPLPPAINFAKVELLSPSNQVLATTFNTVVGDDVTIAGFTLPEDGSYKVRVSTHTGAPAAGGNYTILAGDATVRTAPVSLNQVTRGQLSSPFAVDRWTFTGQANQQIQFNLLASQAPNGILFDLIAPDGTELFTNLTASSDIITLPANGQYVLKAHATLGQSGAYSFSLNQINVTELTLGQSFNGQLLGGGQLQLFKFDVADAAPVQVRLDDVTNADTNEIYLRRGAAPTRGTFDFRSNDVTADPLAQIPLATPGTWFVLVVSRTAASPSNYSLLASSSAIFLNDISPDRSATNSMANVVLEGSGFVPGTTVELIAPDNSVIAAENVLVNSFSQLTATFDLDGAALGDYDVRATLPSGPSATRADAFQVLAAGNGEIKTRLVLPDVVGRHGIATIFVEYENRGNTAMPAPILTLQSGDADGSDKPLLTLNQTNLAKGFWTSALPEGFSNSVQIYASGAVPGVLGPGEKMQVPVYYAGLQQPWDFSDNSVEFEVRIHEAGSTDPIDWNAQKDLLRPSWISAATWDIVFANLVAQVGTTYGEYVDMLSANAVYLGRLGLNVSNVGDLFNFQVQQAMGIQTISTLASETDAAIPVPGLPLAFSRTYANSLVERNHVGPFGRGWIAPWQDSLSERADATVEIRLSGGAVRVFQPDQRTAGRYFSQSGDTGVLRKVAGGAYELTETNGQVTRFRADRSLEYIQDLNGNRITATFLAGRLTGLAHSSGPTLAITYNPAGLISSVTSRVGVADVTGRTTTYLYDGDQRLVSATSSRGTTLYGYDSSADPAKRHALTSITDPTGVVQRYEYDAFGRLSATFLNADVHRVNYQYDVGRVTSTGESGISSKVFFDHRGLVVRTENGLGDYLRYQYDAQSNLVGMADSQGHTTSYTRHATGRPLAITDELGNTTRFTLGGPNNEPTAFTDALGNRTQFGYNAAGNMTATTHADASVDQTAVDVLGRSTSTTNRRNQAVTLQRNAIGQVTRETFPDGTFNEFTYDVKGRLATARDVRGEITSYTYDSADRLTRVDYPDSRFVQYTYDAAGRRTLLADNSGFEVRYFYDTAGRLSEIKDAANARLVLYTYDDAGRLVREDKGNGTFTLYGYDNANRITSIVNRADAGTVNSRFDYTYDALSRRTSVASLDGTWTYTYDLTGQLTRAVFASANTALIPNQDLRYEYDAVGNRIKTIENGVTVNYARNTLNEYTSVGGVNNTYDLDGNLTSDGTRTYAYDALNRLVQVVSGGTTWQYEYDAFGNRVATVENGQRTEYLLDPQGSTNIIGTFNGAGTRTASYAHGLGLEAAIVSGATGFYDSDVLGSTAGISGAARSYTSTYAYEPFGDTLRSSESFANPFQFVGASGVTEEGSGLDFMRARFYSSDIGRFISEDPLGIEAGDANVRRYVNNNPVNETDPSGLGRFGMHGRNYDWWAITDYFNIQPAHEQYFFDDGWNVGFFPGGVANGSVDGDPDGLYAGENIDEYTMRGEIFDDAIMSQAIQNVNPGTWYIVGNNCQTWADAVRAEYRRLAANPAPPPVPLPLPTRAGDVGTSDNVTSQDPNEIIGPSGFGPQNEVPAVVTFPYRVNFENFSGASAPAQRVVVTNVLSPSFDLNTFQFTDLGWGDIIEAAPPGSQHFEVVVPMTFNNKNFDVEVVADLDVATRTVTVTYQSIDPATNLPPDVLTGFLPPEDGTGRGLGHFSYRVRPVMGTPQGTEIRNVALIKFDANEIIATNQVDEHDASKGTDPNKEALVTIGAPSQILRKNGTNVELVNDLNEVLFSQPLTSTTPITVNGPADEAGMFVLDYASEGIFTVLGGIHYTGNAAGHDRIVVKGDVNVTLAHDKANNVKVTVPKTGKKPTILTGVDRATLIGGAGKNVFKASSFKGDVTFDGGANNDTFTGGSGNDTFLIGEGKKSIKGNAGNDKVIAAVSGIVTLSNTKLAIGAVRHTLSKVEQAELTGGADNETFIVTSWTGTAKLAGGGGTDKIVSVNSASFSLTDASLVRSTSGTFALSSIEAAELTGGAKADVLDASAFSGFTYLNGKAGNDTLKGGKGGSILLGGTGNDMLTGNEARDLLFGGGGLDALKGGTGEDLLVARRTTIEGKQANVDALYAVWNRTDLTYQERQTLLITPVKGQPTLHAKLVKSDKLADTLTGGGNLDWFFAKPAEVADLLVPEVLTALT